MPPRGVPGKVLILDRYPTSSTAEDEDSFAIVVGPEKMTKDLENAPS